MDPVTIAQAIAGFNHATSIVKKIAGHVKETEDTEALTDFLDLQSGLMDLQLRQQDLITENGFLRHRIKELEVAQQFEGELIRDGNCLYLRTDGTAQRPYCMACWGYERKLIDVYREDNGKISCHICEARGRTGKGTV